MNERTVERMNREHEVRQAIAQAALEGIRNATEAGTLPDDAADYLILEGLFLAMQLRGGPQQAAQVIGYCLVRVCDK